MNEGGDPTTTASEDCQANNKLLTVSELVAVMRTANEIDVGGTFNKEYNESVYVVFLLLLLVKQQLKQQVSVSESTTENPKEKCVCRSATQTSPRRVFSDATFTLSRQTCIADF